LETINPNEYFGGCSDTTAGTLCCSDSPYIFGGQCHGSSSCSVSITTTCVDSDGDGVSDCGPDYNPFTTVDNDCNDANPGVYPGNTETCDAIDNDCDDFINE